MNPSAFTSKESKMQTNIKNKLLIKELNLYSKQCTNQVWNMIFCKKKIAFITNWFPRHLEIIKIKELCA